MFDFFGEVGSAIMAPLYFVTSVVLSGFHRLFGTVFGEDSGAAWALSISRRSLTPMVRESSSRRRTPAIEARTPGSAA